MYTFGFIFLIQSRGFTFDGVSLPGDHYKLLSSWRLFPPPCNLWLAGDDLKGPSPIPCFPFTLSLDCLTHGAHGTHTWTQEDHIQYLTPWGEHGQWAAWCAQVIATVKGSAEFSVSVGLIHLASCAWRKDSTPVIMLPGCWGTVWLVYDLLSDRCSRRHTAKILKCYWLWRPVRVGLGSLCWHHSDTTATE